MCRDLLRLEIQDLRKINLSVDFRLPLSGRPGENSIEDPIAKSSRARARYIDSSGLFAHLKYAAIIFVLKDRLSRPTRRSREGGCLARVARGGSTERTDAGSSGRTRVPRRRAPGLHRMGFNLCPVSRSAKWNLFASLCGATRFCAAPPRRLTRNYI